MREVGRGGVVQRKLVMLPAAATKLDWRVWGPVMPGG